MQLKVKFNLNKNIKLLEQSGYFDTDYYLKNNPDIDSFKKSAAKHYLLYGGFEGRNPSVGFDSASYLAENSDIKENGMNPLLHFIRFGIKEKRILYTSESTTGIEKKENEVKNEAHKRNYQEKMLIEFPQRIDSFVLDNNGKTEFINTYFDRIYVINLRRRQNKLIEIIQKLKRLNIEAEIIEAVDGYKSPHIEEYETYKNTPLGLGNAHKNEILEKRKMIYSPGVWGHLKSNRLILEDAIKKGYQRILILEDDAVFIKDFHREFAKFTEIISGKEWKFIYLGASQPCWDIPECIVYSDKTVTEYDSIQPYYHPGQTNGSFALALHQSQFRSIIDKIDEMNCPFDWFYKYSFKHLSDECYVAQPNLIIADTSVSDNRPGDVTSEQKALAIKQRKWDLKKYDFI
jgi:GR25 family glycosyltransferase involved in LPS biosynthesis